MKKAARTPGGIRSVNARNAAASLPRMKAGSYFALKPVFVRSMGILTPMKPIKPSRPLRKSPLIYRLVSFGRAEVHNKAGQVVFSGSPVKAWKIVKESEKRTK